MTNEQKLNGIKTNNNFSTQLCPSIYLGYVKNIYDRQRWLFEIHVETMKPTKTEQQTLNWHII